MSDKRVQFLDIMRDRIDKMEYDTDMNLLFHYGRIYAENVASAQIKKSTNDKISDILRDTFMKYHKMLDNLSIGILDPKSIVLDKKHLPEEETDREMNEDEAKAFLTGVVEECKLLFKLFSEEEEEEDENGLSFFKIRTRNGLEFVGTIPADLVEIFEDAEDVEEAFTNFLKSFRAKV